ncbi:O-Antigen ligase [Xylanibacter ruminicola]|jgi:hypothetical protein|uniref:O-Antigen ligase n=1 Tax=Xylanibacter ruminicola TaxID=839 RepID=A0A1H4F0U8_XYLRU|nr:O-antigen ligase family protein [Xylanibacter ruminicola]SEA90883.1 O-Antigen ligase [Xylanibacter ruminicola]
MVNKVYSNRISEYTHENGGRVLILFLLFGLALYQFLTIGLSAFAIICVIPLTIPVVYIAFKKQMATFWLLIIVNYFIQFLGKNRWLPNGVPMSIYNELLEILIILTILIDIRKNTYFSRIPSLMFLMISTWCIFCILQIFNNTCDLGLDIGGWFTGARMMAFQLMYAFLVFTLVLSTPDKVIKYLKLWAYLCLFSAFWTWKQQHIGFTPAEDAWLQTTGRSTHIINGGTLTRYFSTFNDAACYGIHAASAAIAFLVIGITSKIKKDKYFYIVTAIIVIWQMFASGTRTATFCLIAGYLTFLVLSKSVRILIPSAIIGGILFFILMFTTIGNGNQQIRRMRSGFNKNDASANVRDINQTAIKKYLADAPWGIGLGASFDNVPANNKFNKLSKIPPDSEYVFIWVHTGVIGITTFLITTTIMFTGACWIVFFRLKNRSLMGVGAGLCAAFVSMQLGGYANQVLMQFPNCLTFYGGLAMVYILPYIEAEWIELETKRFTEQEEKKRLKIEKKNASRV